ncbi:hypothetical protein E2P84_03640 [Burkholderia cepacia]|uniref:Uncharacterized protein n=2 Tax=root TaxID=1 RepID=R4JEU5_9CAUD|nr:hypothetical protein M190_gp44 [Burkholderia phage ST79]AGK86803.1 hypothetical protein ST79_045 [Burkholderia phage ST79]TES82248.1 hypothetical protein E2P84_03640 [Burkholderia cepacia]
MRRLLGTIGFAIAGLVSVIAWSAVDSRLCTVIKNWCTPPAGTCGGGVDACAATTHATMDLFVYLFGPPILFAALGFFVFTRRRPSRIVVAYLVGAVIAQWVLWFIGVRLLHI